MIVRRLEPESTPVRKLPRQFAQHRRARWPLFVIASLLIIVIGLAGILHVQHASRASRLEGGAQAVLRSLGR